MPHEFDPGYFTEPFRTLCSQYPESDVYPAAQFRLEWGPYFIAEDSTGPRGFW